MNPENFNELYIVLGEQRKTDWIQSSTVAVSASDIQVCHLFLNAKQNKLEQVYRISRKSGVSESHSAEQSDATLDFTEAASCDNLSPSTPIKANNGHG